MKQTAKEIDLEAADWAAKVDRGLSQAEESELEAWLALDPRRLGAFGMMRAACVQTQRAAALGPHFNPDDHLHTQPSRWTRRSLLVGGGSLAATVTLGLAAGLNWFKRDRYETIKGETRELALEDGSVITLNTDSQVSVKLTRNRREIELTRGEALFEVSPDKTRPFVVLAGATEAQALGTSFSVRRLPDQPVEVLVRTGVVQVSQGNVEPVTVKMNMRTVSSESASSQRIEVVTLQSADLQRKLAWRDGNLSFEGKSLGLAALEFARYSDTKIVVDDPGLAKEEIAGLFHANDPVGFAKAVAASLNARAEVLEGKVRIHR